MHIFDRATRFHGGHAIVGGGSPLSLAVAVTARRAVARIGDGGGLHLLECPSHRFRAHSMFDAQFYRTKEGVAACRERDPIARLKRWLERAGHLHGDDAVAIEADAAAEVEDAVGFAEAGTLEPVAELERFVTMDEVPS